MTDVQRMFLDAHAWTPSPAMLAEAIAKLECGCGHPFHLNLPCTGTLGSMSDGDMVWLLVSEGASRSEPCTCTEYVPQ